MNLYLAGVPGNPENTEYKLDNCKRLFSLFDLIPPSQV
jgi:hypothetical protein